MPPRNPNATAALDPQQRFTGFGRLAGPPQAGGSAIAVGQAALPPVSSGSFAFGVPLQQAVVSSSSRPKKKKRKSNRVHSPPTTGPSIFAPPSSDAHVPPMQPNPVAAASQADTSELGRVAKKANLWCYKCRNDDHLSKDCTITHYCYICNNYKHPLHRCSVLKQPKPMASFGGVGLNEALFSGNTLHHHPHRLVC